MIESALYVVATPIGNLGDITFRAIDTLKNVNFILAEDTRVSKILLNHYSIETPLVSYRDQNHDKVVGKAIEKLSLGLSLALISDSGTPTISDPGYKLVRDVAEKGYKVVTIPGPSAIAAAMSISGLPTDRFTYLGFLPKSDSKRGSLLEQYCFMESTVVLYESPNRLLELISQLIKVVGAYRECAVVNNMTKLSEKVVRGSLGQLEEHFKNAPTIKGEFVVLLSKEDKKVL